MEIVLLSLRGELELKTEQEDFEGFEENGK